MSMMLDSMGRIVLDAHGNIRVGNSPCPCQCSDCCTPGSGCCRYSAGCKATLVCDFSSFNCASNNLSPGSYTFTNIPMFSCGLWKPTSMVPFDSSMTPATGCSIGGRSTYLYPVIQRSGDSSWSFSIIGVFDDGSVAFDGFSDSIENINCISASDGMYSVNITSNTCSCGCVTCPSDSCASLPSTFALTVSGLTGNCASANGVYVLTRQGSSCYWLYTKPGSSGYCDSSTPGSIVIIELQCVPLPPFPGNWYLTFLLAPGSISGSSCLTAGQSCTASATTVKAVNPCEGTPVGDYSMKFQGVRCPSDCVDAIFTASVS